MLNTRLPGRTVIPAGKSFGSTMCGCLRRLPRPALAAGVAAADVRVNNPAASSEDRMGRRDFIRTFLQARSVDFIRRAHELQDRRPREGCREGPIDSKI